MYSPLEQEKGLEDESATSSSSVLESTERQGEGKGEGEGKVEDEGEGEGASLTRSIPFFVHEQKKMSTVQEGALYCLAY